MRFFKKEFLHFFNELVLNNNREWYHANKDRFKIDVKEPFEIFVQEMINRISAIDQRILITPKDAIFRIYRDVRFSKDKTPYKTFISAVISPGGRKDLVNPGLYFELSGNYLRIYSGLYMIDKSNLYNIRKRIVTFPKEFTSITRNNDFKEKFGEILGDENKRLPAEFKKPAEELPVLFKKSFYIMAELPSETILEENLPDIIMDYYFTAEPLNDFLREAL